MANTTVGHDRYDRRGVLVRLIDGDTIVADVDLGFAVWMRLVFRLYGINTPEVNKRATRAAGLAAEQHLSQLLCQAAGVESVEGIKLRLRSHQEAADLGTDKYGRYLAVVCVGNTNINEQMVLDGFAVEYMKDA